MPKYSVIITRDITESTVIEIEAPDAEQAAYLAFDKMLNQDDTRWEVDDGSASNSDPYVTDVSPA